MLPDALRPNTRREHHLPLTACTRSRDLLGNVRGVSSEKPPSGTASVTECYDYSDFGRLLSAGDNTRPSCYQSNPENSLTSRLPEKFTGKERDSVPPHQP